MTDRMTTAPGIENVVIESGECRVTLLPAFGGKIASIEVRGQELLQRPLAPIEQRTKIMPFDAGDASGWDECLPSVAACEVDWPGGRASVPDHGDLWRVEWVEGQGTRDERQGTREPGNKGTRGQENKGTRVQGNEGAIERVRMKAACFSLPLELERTVALTETADGWRLGLSYILTNSGTEAAPWSWAAHPLFLAGAGDRIVLPGSIGTLRLEGSGGNRLGTNGDAVNWPLAELADGGTADLRIGQAPESGIGDKLFAGPLSVEENWCALERPSAGVRIRVSFDAQKMPYLGLWICYGGWPERPGPKQTCVALEPATAPVDSLAETGPWSRMLAPGASYAWTMDVDFELL